MRTEPINTAQFGSCRLSKEQKTKYLFCKRNWIFIQILLLAAMLLRLTQGVGHAVPQIVCGQTISSAVTNAAQTDFYEFQGKAGEIVLFTVNGVWPNGCCDTHYALADIYTLDGTKIGSAELSPLKLTLTNDATYRVLVHADNYAAVGPYGINLSIPTGHCGPPVFWGRTVSGTISQFTQTDPYAIEAQSNAVILVTVSAVWPNGCCDTHYAVADIYGPTGTLIGSCENAATPPLTLTNAGTYTVLVHADDYHSGGTYNVALSYILFSGPPWVRIGNTNGAAALNLYGVLGNATTIQYVTNMVKGTNAWLFLTNVNLPYVPYKFVDWATTNVTQRFYRIYQ